MKKHPGFKKVESKIAKQYEKKGMNEERAERIGGAVAANAARKASPAAKKANPMLKKVKGK